MKKGGFHEMKSEHYEHGTDKPHHAKSGGHAANNYGAHDFKSDAMDQAYGQGGMSGCKADQGKIRAQHFTGAFTNDN